MLCIEGFNAEDLQCHILECDLYRPIKKYMSISTIIVFYCYSTYCSRTYKSLFTRVILSITWEDADPKTPPPSSETDVKIPNSSTVIHSYPLSLGLLANPPPFLDPRPARALCPSNKCHAKEVAAGECGSMPRTAVGKRECVMVRGERPYIGGCGRTGRRAASCCTWAVLAWSQVSGSTASKQPQGRRQRLSGHEQRWPQAGEVAGKEWAQRWRSRGRLGSVCPDFIFFNWNSLEFFNLQARMKIDGGLKCLS